MKVDQLPLFDSPPKGTSLGTYIERVGETLKIPEGVQTTPCTHGLHRFPGKFIPNLPRYLIRTILKHRPEIIVFDPFCGSGTTLIEAALEGRKFVGMDIDPLAVAIATAKAWPLSEEEIFELEKYWKQFDYDSGCTGCIPNIPNFSHWFTERAVVQLSSIKARCLLLPPRSRLFSLMVFSSIIRRVSNADDQTQKTYVSHTLPKIPPLPSKVFPSALARAINGMKQFIALVPQPVVGRLLCGDARTPPSLEPFDVLTSPPYIDSIDYVYNQMLEYFWLLPELGLSGFDDYRNFRKVPMGFSPNEVDAVDHFEHRLVQATRRQFQEARREIARRSPKEERALKAFFNDMAKHCEETHRLQGTDAFYICVIGNSVIRKVTVPTIGIVIELFQNVGYRLEDRFLYEIRRHYMKFPRRNNSGKIKEDHILVFRH